MQLPKKKAVAVTLGGTAFGAGFLQELLHGRASGALPPASISGGGVLTLTSAPLQQQAASAASAAWLTPQDEQEEAEQQTLSDVCNEAAPWLSHPQRDVLVTVAAGGVSGALAKTAIAPLARLTILYQVHALQPVGDRAPGLLAALQQVVRQEGVASLWKGNLATILHRVPYSAANFTTFELTKAALEPHVGSDVLRRLLAGAAAGLVACTVAYPLDLVRTRLSAQRDMLPSTTRLTGELARALGVTPDVSRPTRLGAAAHPAPPSAAAASRSTASALLASWRARARGGGGAATHPAAVAAQTTAAHAARRGAAAAAGGAEPSAVVVSLPPSLRSPRNYRGITHAFRCIVREEGLRGLYRGLGATLVQVTPSLAINFCLYDSFRALYLQHRQQQHHHHQHYPTQPSSSSPAAAPQLPHLQQGAPVGTNPRMELPSGAAPVAGALAGRPVGPQSPAGQRDVVEQQQGEGARATTGSAGPGPPHQLDLPGSLMCASGAGFVTSTVTFPLDVVRKRMQTQRGGTPLTYWSACRHILRQHGPAGFYAGIVAEYAKVVPGMAIAFTLYEGIRNLGGVQHRT